MIQIYVLMFIMRIYYASSMLIIYIYKSGWKLKRLEGHGLFEEWYGIGDVYGSTFSLPTV